MDETNEHGIQFIEAGKDAAESLESAEQSFDFIALTVHGPVIFPGIEAIGLGRNYRQIAQIKSQLTGFVAFVGAIHDEGARRWSRPQRQQELPACRGVMGMAGRQGKGYGAA